MQELKTAKINIRNKKTQQIIGNKKHIGKCHAWPALTLFPEHSLAGTVEGY